MRHRLLTPIASFLIILWLAPAQAVGDTIFYEDFADGNMGGWIVGDSNAGSGRDYWGIVNDGLFKPQPWCARNSDGGATLWSDYDNDMYASMIHEVDLRGFKDSYVLFHYYIAAQTDRDFLRVRVKRNGEWSPTLWKTTGLYNWDGKPRQRIDLSAYDNSIIELAFIFESDGAIDYYGAGKGGDGEGAWVDNIGVYGTKLIANATPSAPASAIRNQPAEMVPHVTYRVSAEYTDANGRQDLKYCYLRLDHPRKPLTLMWWERERTFGPWDGEDGKNYVEIVKVEPEEIVNGYKLTWNFRHKPNWPEGEGIDFSANARDDKDAESGFQRDNTSARYTPYLTVSGRIRYYAEMNGPSATTPVFYPAPQIRVELLEKNIMGDVRLASGFTNDDGKYVFDRDETGNKIWNEDPGFGESGSRDLYIKYSSLNEAARVSNNIIHRTLVGAYTGQTTTIYDVTGANHGISVDSEGERDKRHAAALAIPAPIKKAADWLARETKGEIKGWRRGRMDVYFPSGEEGSSAYFDPMWFIGNVIHIPWGKSVATDTIRHEYGHGIHYEARQGSLPSGSVPVGEEDPDNGTKDAGTGSHWIFSESSDGFALTEGWAEFFAAAIGDNQWTPFGNIEDNNFWMGRDGQDGTNDDNNSGAIVEGSTASIFWDIFDGKNGNDDDIDAQYSRLFDIFLERRLDNAYLSSIMIFRDRFGTSEALESIYIDHGIPVTDDAFDSGVGNDTFSTASQLGEVAGIKRWSRLILADNDYYAFSLKVRGGPSDGVAILFDRKKGKLKIELIPNIGIGGVKSESSGSLGGIDIAMNPASDVEAISLANVSAGRQTIRVYGVGGDLNPQYQLVIRGPLPDGEPPSVPTGVTATAIGLDRIKVAWNSSIDSGGSGLAGYRVMRDGSSLPSVTETFYVDSGLAANTEYAYTVAAYDHAGNVSPFSEPPAKATTPQAPDRIAPTTPTNLLATPVSSSQIGLSWLASSDSGGSGLAGYRIYRNGAMVGDTQNNSYPDTGLEADREYAYTVAAFDKAGNVSPQSSIEKARTFPLPDTTAPTIPADLRGVPVDPWNIDLSWTASTDSGGSGLLGYKIYRDNTFIGSTTGTKYSDTGLTPDREYSYTIAAFDGAQNHSPRSAPTKIRTPGAPTTIPPETSITSGPTGRVTVNKVRFTFTSTVPRATFSYRLDPGKSFVFFVTDGRLILSGFRDIIWYPDGDDVNTLNGRAPGPIVGIPAGYVPVFTGSFAGYTTNPNTPKYLPAAVDPSGSNIILQDIKQLQDGIYYMALRLAPPNRDPKYGLWAGLESDNPMTGFDPQHTQAPGDRRLVVSIRNGQIIDENNFSLWSSTTEATFDSLKDGVYRFRARAKAPSGQIDLSDAAQEFSIETSVGSQLMVSTRKMEFSTTEGKGDPPTQTVDMWNAGNGVLDWAIYVPESARSWISVSPERGISRGERTSVTVKGHSVSISAGTYETSLAISAAGAKDSPQDITVKLTVMATPLGPGRLVIQLYESGTANVLPGRIWAGGAVIVKQQSAAAFENLPHGVQPIYAIAQGYIPVTATMTIKSGTTEASLDLTKDRVVGTASLPILMYHKVDVQRPSNLWVNVDNFQQQMEFLRRAGFRTVTPEELERHYHEGGSLSNRPVLLTFDDGLRNQYQHAFPILRTNQLVGVFYIPTAYIADTDVDRVKTTWDPDPTEAAHVTEHLIWSEIQEMVDTGFVIVGGHSRTHPNLAQLANPEDEIRECWKDLTRHVPETRSPSFAYPYGKGGEPWDGSGPDPRVVYFVHNAGYTLGISAWGDWQTPDKYDRFTLRRIYVKGSDTLDVFKKHLRYGISVDRDKISFGNVEIGQHKDIEITLSNTDVESFSGNIEISNPFTTKTQAYNLSVGTSLPVKVTFTPTQGGSQEGNLTFTGIGGVSIQLIGIGIMATTPPPPQAPPRIGCSLVSGTIGQQSAIASMVPLIVLIFGVYLFRRSLLVRQ